MALKKVWMSPDTGNYLLHVLGGSLGIYDKYEGFGKLHGIQVMGKAELVEPFSDSYNAHAAFRKIPLSALQKLSSPMHLICVHPTRMDCLFSDFKELGCGPRQTLILDET